MPGSILARAAVLCSVLITAVVAQTPTTRLSSCRDDLDDLHKASAEASQAAGDAKSKERQPG